MKLLIDLGNTRLKWCTVEAGELSPVQALVYAEIAQERQLRTVFSSLGDLDSVLVSSVLADDRTRVIFNELTEILPAPLSLVQCEEHKLGVRFAYEDMSQMGVDRYLGLIAARRQTQACCCVVSCGTATTLDVLDGDGLHQGGLIMPGAGLMIDALLAGTDRIRSGEGELVSLASTTEDGVFSGCYHLLSQGLESLLRQQRQIYGNHMQFIFTGGNAETISRMMTLPVQLRPELVMQGLQALAEDKG